MTQPGLSPLSRNEQIRMWAMDLALSKFGGDRNWQDNFMRAMVLCGFAVTGATPKFDDSGSISWEGFLEYVEKMADAKDVNAMAADELVEVELHARADAEASKARERIYEKHLRAVVAAADSLRENVPVNVTGDAQAFVSALDAAKRAAKAFLWKIEISRTGFPNEEHS